MGVGVAEFVDGRAEEVIEVGAGFFGDDVDDAGVGVCAPDGSAGAADDFDLFDVFHEEGEVEPFGGSEDGVESVSSVDEDERSVGELAEEAADADGVSGAVEASDIDAGDEAEDVGDVGCAGVVDVVVGEDADGDGGPAEFLFGARGGDDDGDLHELFDAHFEEVVGGDGCGGCAGGQGGCDDDHQDGQRYMSVFLRTLSRLTNDVHFSVFLLRVDSTFSIHQHSSAAEGAGVIENFVKLTVS